MSELRDEVEAIDVEDNDILEFAVKIRDSDLLRYIVTKKHAWEDNRHHFGMEGVPYTETKEFRRIVEKYTTLTVGDAAEKEKWGLLKYFTSEAEDPEIKNLKLTKWLIEFVDNEVGKDVTQLQISGEQGAGKTDFAFLLAELWKFQTNGRVILTNVKDVDGTVYVDSRDALEDWLDKNADREFMFVFDEANKHASGSDHEEVVQQLFELITFLRKKQGNYIIIGHVGTDIHPWIRELTTYIEKHSKKRATVYERLNDSGDPEDPIRTIRNIPKSSLSPDTFDESDWEWGEEQTRQCVGTTKDGDRCGAVTRAEWGENPDLFCDSHSNQDEPHPDVSEEELIGTEFEDGVLDDPDLMEQPEDEETDGEEDIDSDGEDDSHKDTEDRAVMDETGGGRDDNSESNSEADPATETQAESETEEQTEEDDLPDTMEETFEGEPQEESDEPSVEDVPARFWEILEERTGGAYRKATVDDLDTFEEILNQAQWEELHKNL